MQKVIKAIWTESKGKSSSKASAATDVLQYLMNLNASITQAVVKTMEHLMDVVFVSMANLTLTRRDSYLTRVKTGIKPDTLHALRTAPLHIPTLSPDSVIKRAGDDIASFENKEHSSSSRKGRYHPYKPLQQDFRLLTLRQTSMEEH